MWSASAAVPITTTVVLVFVAALSVAAAVTAWLRGRRGRATARGGEESLGSKDDPMVRSVELEADGIVNINEIQLWRLAPDGALTNVARTGTATLVQGHADRYFNVLTGVSAPGAPGPAYNAQAVRSVNNGFPLKPHPNGGNYGFQFTTIPIGATSHNGYTYPTPAKYPIIRITLATPRPLSELLSTVIFNRYDGARGRLGRNRVILRGTGGEIVSRTRLPDYDAMPDKDKPKYVRVDYRPAVAFGAHTTTLAGEATTKIIDGPGTSATPTPSAIAATPAVFGGTCQGMSDHFGTHSNVTWGRAPAWAQEWWKAQPCDTAPTCHEADTAFPTPLLSASTGGEGDAVDPLADCPGVTPWSEWTRCSRDVRAQTRTRSPTGPVGFLGRCPALMEQRPCGSDVGDGGVIGDARTISAIGGSALFRRSGEMVHSVELHEMPQSGAFADVWSATRVNVDLLKQAWAPNDAMNINEIQLWRLAPDGTLTNVARGGTATLVQGNADRNHAARGGVNAMNNGVLSTPGGFQLHTVPVKSAASEPTNCTVGHSCTQQRWDGEATLNGKWVRFYHGHWYPLPVRPPVVRITLATPVPFGELLSAVIFNRTDCCTGRLGKDLVVLRGAGGKIVSQVQLPDYNAVPRNRAKNEPKYVRVDYRPASGFGEHTTTLLSQANRKIISTTAQVAGY